MFTFRRARRRFTSEMDNLNGQLLAMGRLTEDRLRIAIRTLIERDPVLAKIIVEGDDDIDHFHTEVDDRCLTLLALYQPAAVDLRTIVAAVKIGSYLERVGDLAVNIAEATQRYLTHPPVVTLEEIRIVADLSRSMLHDALEAFVSRNLTGAEAVLNRDTKLDGLKTDVFRELLSSMFHDRRTIEPVVNLILIARHLERIGNYAARIAQDVIFIVGARNVEHRAVAAL